MRYLLLCLLLYGCASDNPQSKYIFFLHNRYAQQFPLSQPHPEYGVVEYDEIVSSFEEKGFRVISELRKKDTDVNNYALKVCAQVDSLLKTGVKPTDITIVGTSMGGYIAKYVSSTLQNNELSFVLIGCCLDEDVSDNPEIQIHGNILSIYEESDTLGQSCEKLREHSNETISRYSEIALSTGMRHGFLYKALGLWLNPAVRWASGQYDEFELK